MTENTAAEVAERKLIDAPQAYQPQTTALVGIGYALLAVAEAIRDLKSQS